MDSQLRRLKMQKRKSEERYDDFIVVNKENLDKVRKVQENSLAKDQKIIEVNLLDSNGKYAFNKSQETGAIAEGK